MMDASYDIARHWCVLHKCRICACMLCCDAHALSVVYHNRVHGYHHCARRNLACTRQCRDGQYFHYLTMWMFALSVLGQVYPKYTQMGIQLVKQVCAVVDRMRCR